MRHRRMPTLPARWTDDTLMTRREALAIAGSAAAIGLLGGCGGSGPGLTTAPSGPPQPVPAGPITDATITVGAPTTASLPASFVGLSYEKNKMAQPLFTGGNSDLIALFRRLGSGVLRIGGNSVDETTWAPSGAGQTTGEVAPSDIDALAAFATATGWPVLYGVNFAQSTASAAASEVAYAANALGANLLGIEIGNEPDLYAGKYFASSYSYADWFAGWQSFASAIRTASPGVPLTGPVVASKTTWFTSFAEASTGVVLLSNHYYRANGQSPSSTIDLLVSYPDTRLQSLLTKLETAASGAGLPFRMAETNSFYNGGAPGISDSYASALWVIEHLFTIAAGGGVGVNMHGGGNGPGYTPIADTNGVVSDVRPEYYGLLLFSLAGQGPILATSITAGGLNTSAFTVANSASQRALVVVNADPTQNLAFTATLPSPVSRATLQQLTGPALSATTGAALQGAAVGLDGSLVEGAAYGLAVSGARVTGYVAAASAALVIVHSSS